MAPDNIPVGVADFTLGVQARNLLLVTEALKAGVQPDTKVNGRHPLMTLLGTSYEELPPGLQAGMTREEFGARTSEIVNTLFDRGVKVAEEDKYKTPTQSYLADRFLLSDDVNDAATIVLHAIHETLQDGRPAYKPDIPLLIATILSSGAVSEDADYKVIAEKLVDEVDHLHETVRGRLQNPQNEIEREVAAAGGETKYWADPMQRPDMAEMLAQLGLSQGGRRVVVMPPGAQRELSEAFSAQAEQTPDFVKELEKKPAKQVIDEMSDAFVGLDTLKSDAKRLVFRQNYEAARTDQNLAPTDAPQLSTAYMGFDGVGKSSFAHKQAELLVSLGLAGPNLVEITHDNLGKMAGSYTTKVMAQYFARADIINIELSGGPRGPDFKNMDDYILEALQASLDARSKPPILLFSGWREDVENALENAPGIKPLISNFVKIEEPTIEQLGKALDKKLAGPGGAEKPLLVIDKDARDLVLQEFTAARKRLGSQGFRNMREVDAVAEKAPDALAERIFGSEESELALTTAGDREKLLKTVTLADIKALDLRKVLGGSALMRRPGIGFGASI